MYSMVSNATLQFENITKFGSRLQFWLRRICRGGVISFDVEITDSSESGFENDVGSFPARCAPKRHYTHVVVVVQVWFSYVDVRTGTKINKSKLSGYRMTHYII